MESTRKQKVKINVIPNIVEPPTELELLIDPDMIRTSEDKNTETGEEEKSDKEKPMNENEPQGTPLPPTVSDNFFE
jgi:hypothetical protein